MSNTKELTIMRRTWGHLEELSPGKRRMVVDYLDAKCGEAEYEAATVPKDDRQPDIPGTTEDDDEIPLDG